MIPALNAGEIGRILRIHAKKTFRNIAARGKLPVNINKFPSFYLINTDYYYESGVHWVFIGFFEKFTLFFDSFGLSPVYYNYPIIVKQKGVPLIQSTKKLQGRSSACGYYCIYFIYFLSRGFD